MSGLFIAFLYIVITFIMFLFGKHLYKVGKYSIGSGVYEPILSVISDKSEGKYSIKFNYGSDVFLIPDIESDNDLNVGDYISVYFNPVNSKIKFSEPFINKNFNYKKVLGLILMVISLFIPVTFVLLAVLFLVFGILSEIFYNIF